MVLNPFRCKQYWVSSILERNTLLAKIQTNKKKLTLFSEGCWYPHRELQSYTFLIYRGIFLYVFGLTFEFSFLLAEGDNSPTLSGTYTSVRTLSKVSCFDFWDATGQAYVQEKKCSGVLVMVLVINKLLLHFDPTSGRDWAVPAHLTVFAVFTKGSLMDEKHLPKTKFATYILNPDHAAICHSPEYWPGPAPSLLHAERLSWKAQLQQNL